MKPVNVGLLGLGTVGGGVAQVLQRNADEIAELRRIVEREENIRDDNARTYFEANRNIHRAFVEMAQNRFLLEMFQMIWGKAMAFHLFAAIENVDLAQSLGDHMALVDVIESGDKTAALEVFTRHIQDGFDLQMQGLQQAT